MATVNINISVVNSQIAKYAEAYGVIAQKFSQIDSNYLNSIQNKWNTKTAHKYFSSLSTALNGTISDMNKGFSEASNCIQKAATHITTAEGGATVKSVTTPTIKATSIGWQGQDDNYKISDEVSNDTKDNFSSNMAEIVSKAEECKSAMEQIRDNGLSDYISGNAIAQISKMIESAKEVNKTYDDKAVTNAATEDANVKGYKIQTS